MDDSCSELCKMDKCNEVDSEIEAARRPSVVYPYTARTKRALSYRKRLDKSWENYLTCQKNKKQIRGTEIIRDAIASRRSQFLCHQKERARIDKEKKDAFYNKMINEYKIDLVDSKMRIKLSNKIHKKQQEAKQRRKEQQHRMNNIVEKLLKERELKELEDVKQRKEKPPKKFVLPKSDVTDQEFILTERHDISFSGELEEFNFEEVEYSLSKKKKPKRTVAPKFNSSEGFNKESKKSKSPVKQSKKVADDVLILPEVPVTNPREKIDVPEEISTDEIMEAFQSNQEWLEERPTIQKQIRNDFTKSYPPETGLTSNPNRLFFETEHGAKIREMKVTLFNSGKETRKILNYEVFLHDGLRPDVIMIEPILMERIRPGYSHAFTVTFNPEKYLQPKDLKGALLFNVLVVETNQRTQLEIPFDVYYEYADDHLRIVIDENSSEQAYDSDTFFFKIDPHPYWNKDIRQVTIKFKNPSLNPLRVKIANNDALDEHCYLESRPDLFSFEKTSIDVFVRCKSSVNVNFLGIDEVGGYGASYDATFIEYVEGKWVPVGKNTIIVCTYITGHFLKVECDPENESSLDFKSCLMDSVYQKRFTVSNREEKSVKLSYKLPIGLKNHIQISPKTYVLDGLKKQDVFVTFLPRKDLLDSKYYEYTTNILSFPIKVTAPEDPDIPPVEIYVYAILPMEEIVLEPVNPSAEKYGVIDLGVISTDEIVTVQIQVHNKSAEKQIFGFLNLPEFVTISPDYGFGKLDVDEKKILTLQVTPTIWDVPTKYNRTNQAKNSDDLEMVAFIIKYSTLASVGGLIDKDYDWFQNTKPETLLLLKKNKSRSSESRSEVNLKEVVSDRASSILTYKTTKSDSNFEESNLTLSLPRLVKLYEEKSIGEEFRPEEYKVEEQMYELKLPGSLNFIARLTVNWCEVSHQYIEFPDTPMGSYSIMHTYLNAFNKSSTNHCVCGYLKSDVLPDYSVHFEIYGGSDDIRIEPTCGDLKKGQSKKLTLVAKPKSDPDIVAEKADMVKAVRMALEEEEMKAKKSIKKKKEKEKKAKNPKKNKKTDSEKTVNIVELYKKSAPITADIYRAERELWRCAQSYTIQVHFIIIVTFPHLPKKKQETIFLEANCRVVRPKFLLNLETQVLDFGLIPVGTRPKKIVELENISDHDIEPVISCVNPIGSIICDLPPGFVLEREHVVKIPITIAPLHLEKFQQHLEIKCGRTIAPFIIKGEGCDLDINFNPNFTVARLEAKQGSKTILNLSILNKSRANIDLLIQKVFEVKGNIHPLPPEMQPQKEEVSTKQKATKKKKDASAKSGSKKKDKQVQTSNELTQEELYSLENFFRKSNDGSQFNLLMEGERAELQAQSKLNVKIVFEKPKNQLESNKKDANAVYVTKYNILVGNIVTVKDFFVIGKYT